MSYFSKIESYIEMAKCSLEATRSFLKDCHTQLLKYPISYTSLQAAALAALAALGIGG